MLKGQEDEIKSGNVWKEIEETKNRLLVVDDVIGNRRVMYWEHVINDIKIKNDYVLLHINSTTGEVLDYQKQWREVNIFFNIDNKFEPEEYYWKEKVIFLDEKDCRNFYTFYREQKYPVICWEVRHKDGTTLLYDFNGEVIGKGVPAPFRIGFSLNGYDENVGPDCWSAWRSNADKWFRKWCHYTVSLASPSPEEISLYIRDRNVTHFYDIAHSVGKPTRFQANATGVYYTAEQLREDMKDREPMWLAVICSCEAMRDVGPGTLSYEFRKGETNGTVTIGYVGMAHCPGWSVSYEWQDYMFSKMDEGYTMKEAFDLACAYYPTIAPCVKFVGDETIHVIENHPPNEVNISGPTTGKVGEEYEYSFVVSDPDDDKLYLQIEWGDNTSWTGMYNSGEKVVLTHKWEERGAYIIKAKVQDTYGAESNWTTIKVSIPIRYFTTFFEKIWKWISSLIFPSFHRL